MIQKILFAVIGILLMLLLYFFFVFDYSRKVEVTLSECIDGDTAKFILNDKQVKVRFLGIDTPENSDDRVEKFGDVAFEYTCGKLKNAEHIYLEFDENSNRYDKYKRMLAWVFVDDDNLSELLVRNGYAMVRYVYDDYLYIDDLCFSQKHAFDEKLGIWNIKSADFVTNYCYKRTK